MSSQSTYASVQFSETTSLFTTATVWFSKPADLNDPFECRPFFTFLGDSEQIVRQLARLLEYHMGMTHDTAVAHAMSIYLEGRHNDPETWDQLRQEVIAKLGSDIGMYCLSETNNNIILWSHYADKHQGFCLEFEATDYTPDFGLAQQVEYSKEYPVVDFFNTPIDKQIGLVFLTKFRDWGYEKEWRIIDHENGPELHEYQGEFLKSVTFGLRMCEEHKKQIRAWPDKREHPVRLWQAKRSETDFRVALVPSGCFRKEILWYEEMFLRSAPRWF